MNNDLPEFEDWSIPTVKLLQGVVYAEEGRAWNLLLSNQSRLESYFSRIGLRLIVDEPEGMAYLRQLGEEEQPDGYESLPKLFRVSRLSYGQTLLCVLFREEFRRFEEEEMYNERCVVEEVNLFDQWKSFFPANEDDVKLRKKMQEAIGKLRELNLVRKLNDEPPTWEIRRILKARLPASELEELKKQLVKAANRKQDNLANNEIFES